MNMPGIWYVMSQPLSQGWSDSIRKHSRNVLDILCACHLLLLLAVGRVGFAVHLSNCLSNSTSTYRRYGMSHLNPQAKIGGTPTGKSMKRILNSYMMLFLLAVDCVDLVVHPNYRLSNSTPTFPRYGMPYPNPCQDWRDNSRKKS